MSFQNLSQAELKAVIREVNATQRRRRGEIQRPTRAFTDQYREAQRPSKRSRGASQRAAIREY